jgi:hypothetical protein
MPESYRVPIIGTANKGVVIAGVGALVFVGGWAIYKHEKAKKAAAAEATAAAIPQTMAYGYGAAAYGYGSQFYGYGSQYAPEEYYGYGAGAYGGGSYPPWYGYGVGGTPTPPPATNASWVQNALSLLNSNGYSTMTALTALSKYIAGQSVTANQASIIQAAEALAGPPPVPGANGFPPAIRRSGNNPGQGQGTGWYWHADLHHFTNNGKRATHGSGNVVINSKTYYYHSDTNDFTLSGHKVSPPSGAATWG